MRSRLSPVPGPWPFQQSARAAVSSGCSSKERCGGPPTAAPSAAPPLVLRVPVCGSAISCVRVGSSSAVLGVGRDLRVFSLSSGRQLGTVSRAAGGVIGSVDVSDEAGLAVCGSRDCTLRWFDFDSFTCQRVSARRSQHTDSVSTVRFVPGTAGRRVISSGLDGRVKLWDTETGQSVQGSQDCSSDSVSAAGLLLSLDFVHPSAGSYVTGATCAGEGNVGEGRVALWDVRTRAGVVSQVTAPCGLIPSVSFCSYNSGIAAGGSDGVVRVYDMRRFTAETLHEVTMPAVPLSAFLLSSVSGSPSPSLSVDAAFGGGGLSLVAPSTSPPSPSVHGGSISSSPPSRRHIQSVCLLPDRLMALQSTALTMFASSAAPPRKTTTFPFAHPIHSLTLRQAVRAANSSSTSSSSAYDVAADSRLVAMQTAEAGDVLALSTSDCLILWGASTAAAATQQRQHTPALHCEATDDIAAALAAARRDERRGSGSGSGSAGVVISVGRPASGSGRPRANHLRERRQSAGRADSSSIEERGGQRDGPAGMGLQSVDDESVERAVQHAAAAGRVEVQRREGHGRRRSHVGEQRAHRRDQRNT